MVKQKYVTQDGRHFNTMDEAIAHEFYLQNQKVKKQVEELLPKVQEILKSYENPSFQTFLQDWYLTTNRLLNRIDFLFIQKLPALTDFNNVDELHDVLDCIVGKLRITDEFIVACYVGMVKYLQENPNLQQAVISKSNYLIVTPDYDINRTQHYVKIKYKYVNHEQIVKHIEQAISDGLIEDYQKHKLMLETITDGNKIKTINERGQVIKTKSFSDETHTEFCRVKYAKRLTFDDMFALFGDNN